MRPLYWSCPLKVLKNKLVVIEYYLLFFMHLMGKISFKYSRFTGGYEKSFSTLLFAERADAKDGQFRYSTSADKR